MNNFIVYFYKMNVRDVEHYDKYYSFIYNDYLYQLWMIDNNINVNNMLNMNKRLLSHTLVSEIIVNKDGNYVSSFNDQNYILIKVFVSDNVKISLEEISYLANTLYNLV